MTQSDDKSRKPDKAPSVPLKETEIIEKGNVPEPPIPQPKTTTPSKKE